MLSILSSTTSLLDLSINDLSNIAWHSMDLTEFADELQNETLIKRMRVAAGDYVDEKSRQFLRDNDFAEGLKAENRSLFYQFMVKVFPEVTSITEYAFYPNIQYPPEFMEKYAINSYQSYYIHQDWITPAIFEERSNLYNSRFDVGEFFDRFKSIDTVIGGLSFAEWFNHEDGKYRDQMITKCSFFRFAPMEDFAALNYPVPDHYHTVLNPQRIMAGDPCTPGQRAFMIWLKKYRRSTGDSTGYPTWAALMEVFKNNPRMNNDGYVNWIWHNCLFKTMEQVSRAATELEIKAVDRASYVTATEDTDIEVAMITLDDISEEMQVAQPVPSRENVEAVPSE